LVFCLFDFAIPIAFPVLLIHLVSSGFWWLFLVFHFIQDHRECDLLASKLLGSVDFSEELGDPHGLSWLNSVCLGSERGWPTLARSS
jgi:hypothetical protein